MHIANVRSSQTPTTHRCEAHFMSEPKVYFVYIMTNRSKTLYTGVTNNLVRRVREHKSGTGSDFAARYKLDRLFYFERFEDVRKQSNEKNRSRAGCG